MFGLDRKPNQVKKSIPSYKLTVSVTPHWGYIYSQVYEISPESSLKKTLDECCKDDGSWSLFGRHYVFTEIYDSVSGLTFHFQQVEQRSRHRTNVVDEFGDEGMLFHFGLAEVPTGSPKKRKVGDKDVEVVRINEYGISLGVGEYGGFDYHAVATFPCDELLNFRLLLGQQCRGAEEWVATKYSDELLKFFNAYGISHEWTDKFGFGVGEKMGLVKGEEAEFLKDFENPKMCYPAYGFESWEGKSGNFSLSVKIFEGSDLQPQRSMRSFDEFIAKLK